MTMRKLLNVILLTRNNSITKTATHNSFLHNVETWSNIL